MARLEIVSRTVAKEREARKVNALPVELMQIAGNKKTNVRSHAAFCLTWHFLQLLSFQPKL